MLQMFEYFMIFSLCAFLSEASSFTVLFFSGLLEDAAKGATATATTTTVALPILLGGSCFENVRHSTATLLVARVAVVRVVWVINVACHVPRMLLRYIFLDRSELVFNLCTGQGAGLRLSHW